MRRRGQGSEFDHLIRPVQRVERRKCKKSGGRGGNAKSGAKREGGDRKRIGKVAEKGALRILRHSCCFADNKGRKARDTKGAA